MKRDFSYPPHDGEMQIHAVEWLPEGRPKAVLQLCHGMCEFIDRHDTFARFMAANGFDTLFCAISGSRDPKTVASAPKDLPLLFVFGEEDPVGGFGSGVKKAFRLYRTQGSATSR